MALSRRQFSTKSIRLAAEAIPTASPTVDNFLDTLSALDRQIHAEIHSLKADLSHSRSQHARALRTLDNETTLRKNLQDTVNNQNTQIDELRRQLADRNQASLKNVTAAKCECPASTDAFFSGEHKPDCAFRLSILKDTAPENLIELLMAREDAYRNQQILVERLKTDAASLKNAYDNMCRRNEGTGQTPQKGSDRVELLSMRVQKAGRDACEVACKVEKRLQITSRNADSLRQSVQKSIRASSVRMPIGEEFDGTGSDVDFDCGLGEAGEELERALALQQEAHDTLRSTVVELTKELERIDPDKVGRVDVIREQLLQAEDQLSKAELDLDEKDVEISELKKQLKKVLAEYEAVSIAHSYSNAELSKIRATNRAKGKDRPADRHEKHDRIDRPHALANGLENRMYHRKIHFR